MFRLAAIFAARPTVGTPVTIGDLVAGLCPEAANTLNENTFLATALAIATDSTVGKSRSDLTAFLSLICFATLFLLWSKLQVIVVAYYFLFFF